MNASLDSTHTAAVDPVYHWRKLDTCPKGVKVQLLTKWGCAVYGSWNGRDPVYTHWAPMPTRARKGEAE